MPLRVIQDDCENFVEVNIFLFQKIVRLRMFGGQISTESVYTLSNDLAHDKARKTKHLSYRHENLS